MQLSTRFNSSQEVNTLSDNSKGLPMIDINHDGTVLCHKCSQERIYNGTLPASEVIREVYWEGTTTQCNDCNCDLRSVYTSRPIT